MRYVLFLALVAVGATNLSLFASADNCFEDFVNDPDNQDAEKLLGEFSCCGRTFMTIPANISNLANLKSLTLGTGNCRFYGQVPFDQLFTLTRLTHLSLRAQNGAYTGGGWTGSIPSGLGALSKLTLLNLYGPEDRRGEGEFRGFNGSIPESIGLLTDLVRLGLGWNLLTGSVPESITNLRELQEMDIEYNYLNGTLPAGMAKMTNLESIIAYGGDMELLKPLPEFAENVTVAFDGAWRTWAFPGKRCNRLQDGKCCTNYDYDDGCMDDVETQETACLDSGFCYKGPKEPTEKDTSAEDTYWATVYWSVGASVVFCAGLAYCIRKIDLSKWGHIKEDEFAVATGTSVARGTGNASI